MPPLAARFIQTPSGWNIDPHDDWVSMFAPSGDAELRVTAVNLERTRIDAAQWLGSVVHANRKAGRVLVASQYGPFTGYTLEIEALGSRIRGWFLRAGGLPLVITYKSPVSVGARDDEAVEGALQGLTLFGAAA